MYDENMIGSILGNSGIGGGRGFNPRMWRLGNRGMGLAGMANKPMAIKEAMPNLPPQLPPQLVQSILGNSGGGGGGGGGGGFNLPPQLPPGFQLPPGIPPQLLAAIRERTPQPVSPPIRRV